MMLHDHWVDSWHVFRTPGKDFTRSCCSVALISMIVPVPILTVVSSCFGSNKTSSSGSFGSTFLSAYSSRILPSAGVHFDAGRRIAYAPSFVCVTLVPPLASLNLSVALSRVSFSIPSGCVISMIFAFTFICSAISLCSQAF